MTMTTLLEPPTFFAGGKPPNPFQEVPLMPNAPAEFDDAEDGAEDEEL